MYTYIYIYTYIYTAYIWLIFLVAKVKGQKDKVATYTNNSLEDLYGMWT